MSKAAERSSAKAAVVFSGDVLRDAALASATLRSYKKNFSKFLKHAGLTLHRFQTLPVERVDHALCSFINHLHASGENKTYANQAFYGAVHMRPELRAHRVLPRAQQSLRGLQRLQVSVPHPPLTWELTVAIAVTLARSGWHDHAMAISHSTATFGSTSSLGSAAATSLSLTTLVWALRIATPSFAFA
jgi:hypothetical protein